MRTGSVPWLVGVKFSPAESVHAASEPPRLSLRAPVGGGAPDGSGGRPARLRALWTIWSVRVRVSLGALEEDPQSAPFLLAVSAGLSVSSAVAAWQQSWPRVLLSPYPVCDWATLAPVRTERRRLVRRSDSDPLRVGATGSRRGAVLRPLRRRLPQCATGSSLTARVDAVALRRRAEAIWARPQSNQGRTMSCGSRSTPPSCSLVAGLTR